MPVFEATSRNIKLRDSDQRVTVRLEMFNGNSRPQRLRGARWTLIDGDAQVQWRVRFWAASQDPAVDDPRRELLLSGRDGEERFPNNSNWDVLVQDEDGEWGWNPNWTVEYQVRGRTRGN